MLKANIEAEILAKQQEIVVAEKEIFRLDALIDHLKDQRAKQLEIRGLAAYDVMELQDQLEEMEDYIR